MKTIGKVVLNEQGERWAKGAHPWIFRGSIAKAEAQDGDVVEILSAAGRPLGMGFFSAASKIAVRAFSRQTSPQIDNTFWAQRLDQAIAYRQRVVQNATAYRLFSSEADGIPGLIIDRYGDCFSLQTLCPATERLKAFWLEHLQSRFQVQCVVERNDVKTRELEGMQQVSGVLAGKLPVDLWVREGDIEFQVDLLHGQKTGAFLDQRENHLAVETYASGRALDAFTYQGGFALHMARHAQEVLAVDSSAPALEVAQKNAQRNGLHNLRFQKAKVFDLLRDLKGQQSFDIISLDPPAFAKNSRDIDDAERGYREINLRAMELLNDAGILITSTCSYHMSEEHFLEVLAQAAGKARRRVRVVEKRGQSKDHPVLLGMPESFYLKCLILLVDA